MQYPFLALALALHVSWPTIRQHAIVIDCVYASDRSLVEDEWVKDLHDLPRCPSKDPPAPTVPAAPGEDDDPDESTAAK